MDYSSTYTVSVANSGFTASIANAVLSAISHTMMCIYAGYSSGTITYTECDASDDTVLSSGAITHDAALAAGWKLVGPGCSTGSTGYSKCVVFHK